MGTPYENRVALVGGLLEMLKSRKAWVVIIMAIGAVLFEVLGWDWQAYEIAVIPAVVYIAGQAGIDIMQVREIGQLTRRTAEAIGDAIDEVAEDYNAPSS